MFFNVFKWLFLIQYLRLNRFIRARRFIIQIIKEIDLSILSITYNVIEKFIYILMIIVFLFVIWSSNSKQMLMEFKYQVIITQRNIDDDIEDINHLSRIVIECLYSAVYTVTTVGYGDYALPDLPSYHEDYLILCVLMMFGFFMYNLLSSNLQILFKKTNLTTSIEAH